MAKKGSKQVDLGERLDITLTGTLKEPLVEAMASGGAVELEGGKLQRVDTAGIQLLVAFNRAAAGQWRWRGGQPPRPVVEAAGRLGLAEELEPQG